MFGSKGAIKDILIVLLILTCFCLLLLSRSVMADTFVWQDFEYWDAPRNYGWQSSCPPYPVYGWCPYTGFGRITTMICPDLQSRVFLYECFMSQLNQFYPFFAWNQSIPDPDPDSDGFEKNIVSFDIRMLLGIEWFDQWEVQINVITRNGEQVNLIYRPVGIGESGPVFTEGRPGDIFTGMFDPPGFVYELGRQYQDGTWHLVVRDLDRDVALALGYDLSDPNVYHDPGRDGFGWIEDAGLPPGESAVASFMLKGYRLQVDNIAFHDTLSDIINHPPKLQRLGPQYAQLFVPFSLMISAADIDILPGGVTDERLEFFATVGGYGSRGVQTTDMIYRIKEDPNNPDTYLITHNGDPSAIPDKVLFQFIPQVFEDLIITMRVVDHGGLSDIETFPLSVVNYPITNNPPYFEEIENDVYILGSQNGQFIKEFICYDKDPGDIPGTVDEPGNFTYKAWIDGLDRYQYGPWQEPLIPNPCKPEIRFTPKFEGLHRIVVSAMDPRGLSAITEFDVIVVNTGTWLNHPPILCEDIDSPQVIRAGQMFTIPVEFFDPDDEPIYYSCNIGSITEMKEGFGITPDSVIGATTGTDKYGRYVNGAFYNFMSHFPGTFHIVITAYDIRGGYCEAAFILDVQPWWTI